MKQTSVIRISFLVCALLIVVAYLGGRYSGQKQNAQSSMETTQNQSLSAEQSDDTQTDTQKNTQESVESMTQAASGLYCIKESNGYLVVYDTQTNEVYFETGVKISDLPEELQLEVQEGIYFSNPEELYSFLENYSS
jgi:hypothetical protein